MASSHCDESPSVLAPGGVLSATSEDSGGSPLHVEADSGNPRVKSKLAAFDEDGARTYDARWSKLEVIRDSMLLQAGFALYAVSSDAHVLCVGAGTGAEVLAMARVYPSWTFTLVDPSAPMMAICKTKAIEAGIDRRCTFLTCFVADLPDDARFDAATSILVSHFITDEEARTKYFRDILARVKPGGVLVTADLCSGSNHSTLLDIWRKVLAHAGASPDQVEAAMETYRTDVQLLHVDRMRELLCEAGWQLPTVFLQHVLIHGICAQKSVE